MIKYILPSFINKYTQKIKGMRLKVFNQAMFNEKYNYWGRGIFGGFFIFACAFFMVTFVPFSDFLGEGEIVYTTVKVPKGK